MKWYVIVRLDTGDRGATHKGSLWYACEETSRMRAVDRFRRADETRTWFCDGVSIKVRPFTGVWPEAWDEEERLAFLNRIADGVQSIPL